SWLRRTLVGLVAVLAFSSLFPLVALAHERRAIGPYTFLVGFLNEPTIQGQPNGLDLTITDSNGKPVLGAEKTLKVAIAYGGGQPRALDLAPSDEAPGKYSAAVIPTKAGTYTFFFSGSINGDPINAQFESGPNTFDDVQSPASLQFPVTVPATADLVQQTQAANATAQAALQRATLLGLAGVAVGLVGLVVAIVAIVLANRPRDLPLIDEPPSEDPTESARGRA
ncbi:MAG: hypothetical protein ACREOS_08040, partial [Candidatus Dormibacteraceae bacterium]